MTFELGQTSTDLSTITLTQAQLSQRIGVLTAFVEAGLVASTGEARRQIKGGGLRLNDEVVQDDKLLIEASHQDQNGVIKLSLGKKKHVLLTFA